MTTDPATRTDSGLLHLLSKNSFIPTVPYDQQVASHLRDLILKRKIPAHTKLPPGRALAELWGTSYHTIYDALERLSGEGIVVLRPRQGTFVAPPRRPLRRLCLYHNFPTEKFLSSNLFYPLLDVFIANLLTQRNVVVFPFYDQRDYKKLHTVPAPIRIMASEGELDAVIATTIFPKHTGWLQRLEVPVASLMLPAPERNIAIGFAQVAAKVVEIAVQHHRKTIGLIHAWVPSTEKEKTDVLGEEIRRLAALHGISVFQPMDIAKHPHGHSMHPDQLGEELCQQLLDDPAPPDMIFVHPDIFVRGVAAALHRRVPVPEKVLVVSHRNAENGAYIPFPMTWITVHIKDFAAALIDQIDRQIAGEKITPVAVPLTVEQSAPFRVPDDSAS